MATTTKKELIDRIADETQLRRSEVKRAVQAFLDHIDFDALAACPVWEEIKTTNPLLSFRLHGDVELVWGYDNAFGE